MATLFDDASLVMIPSGYKDDKLYSIKPTSGDGDFTFSRDGSGASPATRVNSAGLIEKGRENNLLQSNTFDNAAWTLKRTGSNPLPSVSSGFSDPDGGTNAYRFQVTAPSADNDYSVISQTPSFSGVNGTPFVQSIYVKANGAGQIGKFFDLYAYQPSSSSYRSIENFELTADWQRVELFHTFNATGSTMEIAFGKARSSVGGSTLANMATDVLIYSSQLEKGLVATSVIETTTAAASAGILGDMPRLDYSGGASCPSLLLEPSRTNLFPHSEYFGAWSLSNATLTANNEESPEGVVNGYKLNENTANSTHRITQTSFVTTGQVYTQSVFAKGDGSGRYLRIFRGSGTYNFGVFNLTSGEIVSQGGSNLISADIELYSNGWYKCSITFTAQFSNIASYIALQNGAFDSYTGDGTSGIYIYGAQLESGSYATSYIPSYGSATARAFDDCQKISATALIGQTEGAMFVQLSDFPKEFNGRIFAITQNSSNYITILKNGTNDDFRVLVSIGGSNVVDYQGTSTLPSNTKIAVGYANNDYVVYVNGTQVHTDTSASVPTCSNIFVGKRENSTATYSTGGGVKQALLFKTRLTNAELASLTTL